MSYFIYLQDKATPPSCNRYTLPSPLLIAVTEAWCRCRAKVYTVGFCETSCWLQTGAYIHTHYHALPHALFSLASFLHSLLLAPLLPPSLSYPSIHPSIHPSAAAAAAVGPRDVPSTRTLLAHLHRCPAFSLVPFARRCPWSRLRHSPTPPCSPSHSLLVAGVRYAAGRMQARAWTTVTWGP